MSGQFPSQIGSLRAAWEFFHRRLAETDPAREVLCVAHVDRNQVCVHVSHHVGGGSSIDFPMRAIVADALDHRSAGIILAHTHPSGDPRPSNLDRRLTRQLVLIADALDFAVLDHLIFGKTSYTSLRQTGWL